MAQTAEPRSGGPSWPSQGSSPQSFPAEPQSPSPILLALSNAQTPTAWASGSRRGAVFRWPSHPLLSCLVPVDLSRAAESVFEHLPRGMAAGGRGSLLKVLGGQGQSLRVWGPGDGGRGLGSCCPWPMAVPVHQVMGSPEPRFEDHCSLCSLLSVSVGSWLCCPS